MLTTATSDALLAGLLRPTDDAAWSDYVARYRPLLVRYARQLGMPAADAEDVAQDTLLAFATAYREGRYERERGRLRAWLFGIARNTVLAARRRRAAAEVQIADSGAGTGFFGRLASDDELAAEWDRQWQQAVLRQCLLEVQRESEPSTFAAFDLFVQQELPAREVASRTGLSENAVYLAKRRVLQRVRELMPGVAEVF
ncbi:MAG: sigma-70 family RNA polymerase sigma factor [Planctomycetota bacterium]